MKKVRITFEGKLVDAEIVGHTAIEENWNTYKLEDGAVLSVKVSPVQVFKVSTPDPMTGLPQYVCRNNISIATEPPDEPIEPKKHGAN
jgi:hypothetical protein